MKKVLPIARVLDQASATLALGVVIAAPLVFGSVHTTTLLAFSVASLLSLGVLVFAGVVQSREEDEVRGEPIRSGVLPLILGALALWPAAQLIPLPPQLLSWLAPETAAIASDALGDAAGWRPITLDIPATARELVRALGLAALFATLRHHARRPGFRRRLLASLALTGVGIAASAFVHLALGVDSFLGFWRPTAPSPLPLPFGNANHAAGVLNASALLALGFAASPRSSHRALWTAGAGITFAASVSLGSRGGLIAGGIGLCVIALTTALGQPQKRSPRLRRQLVRLLLPSFAATLIAGAAVTALHSEAREAAKAVMALDLFEDGKLIPVHAALAVTKAQPWTGIGRGAFEVAHPRWLDDPSPVSFTHVENEAVQALAELGIPAALILLSCLGIALFLLLRKAQRKMTEAGALAAALGLLIQGLGDFGLHFASGFWLFALLSTPAASRPTVSRPSTRMGLAATGTVGFVTALGISLALPDLQNATRVLEKQASDRSQSLADVEQSVLDALRLRPADHVLPLIAASRALADGRPDIALDWANRALLLHPHGGEANRLAGIAFAELGRRDEALIQFRLAMERGVQTTETVLRYFPDSDALHATTPTTLQPSLDAASALLKAGKLKDGLAILNRVEPGDSPAFHYLRGVLAQRAGEFELAHRSAKALREIEPELPTGWILDAGTWARRKRFDQAREVLAQGSNFLGPNAWIELELARVSLAAGEVDEAARILDQLTPTTDQSLLAERHTIRGTIHRARGEVRRAREAFERAAELAPNREDLRRQLGELNDAVDVLIDEVGVRPSADVSDWMEIVDR